MNAFPLTAETTVATTLEHNPGSTRVFIARRTACIGCYMARFCTLQDTAQAYNLEWDAFIADLRSETPEPGSGNGGANASNS